MNLDRIAPALDFALPPCLSNSAPEQADYSFATIEYPGDSFTQLLGINNGGVIAGYHGVNANKGFIYDLSTKTFTDEKFPGSAQTRVTGINNLGRISGSYVTTSGRTLGFTAKGGVYTLVTLHGTPFNRLLSQNDFAQAAGHYNTEADGSGPDHAYIYDEGGEVFETFTFPDSVSAQATGINNLGDVCGFTIDGSGKMHGWLQVWGRVTQFDFPGATATRALGLNNKGEVVGSYTDSSGNTHGFVYMVSTKKWQSIDDPSGIDTVVNGINDNGVLVGFFGTSPTNSGFVATPR
jgi:probable HAF family extracellular repeat protein